MENTTIDSGNARPEHHVMVRESTLSVSAIDAVRLRFNPSGLDEVAEIKLLTAALITKLEDIRNRDGGYAGREAAVAITHVQTASMWSVLAATKGK